VEGVAGVCPVQSQIENYRAKAKEFARLTVLQNRFGIAANTGSLLRCIGRWRSVKNLIARSPQNRTSKEHDMTTYSVEFHRRLEQKWASRIDQILTFAANATPPRER
jgi:hypothetical protein